MFNPKQTPRAFTRYVTKHKAKKVKLKQFVLDRLREAKDIIQAWIAERGLKADQDTFVILRKCTGAVLTKLNVTGVAQASATDGDYKGWSLTGKGT